MSSTKGPSDRPLQRRAVSTRARAGGMLLALLPGMGIEAWGLGPAFTARIAGVLLGAAVAELMSRDRLARREWNPTPLLMALLVLLWLPAALSWWLGVGAAGLAYAVARAFGRTSGASAFHPAMIGGAMALLLAFPTPLLPTTHSPTTLSSLGESSYYAIAGAWICGGIVLAMCRCIRWQVVVAFWLGTAVVAFAWLLPGGHATGDAVVAAFPSTALVGFYVVVDPSSSCTVPRARWLFGAGVGLLSGLALLALQSSTMVLFGMAGAVLLMNAAAPWLDTICERPRGARNPTAATSG